MRSEMVDSAAPRPHGVRRSDWLTLGASLAVAGAAAAWLTPISWFLQERVGDFWTGLLFLAVLLAYGPVLLWTVVHAVIAVGGQDLHVAHLHLPPRAIRQRLSVARQGGAEREAAPHAHAVGPVVGAHDAVGVRRPERGVEGGGLRGRELLHEDQIWSGARDGPRDRVGRAVRRWARDASLTPHALAGRSEMFPTQNNSVTIVTVHSG